MDEGHEKVEHGAFLNVDDEPLEIANRINMILGGDQWTGQKSNSSMRRLKYPSNIDLFRNLYFNEDDPPGSSFNSSVPV